MKIGRNFGGGEAREVETGILGIIGGEILPTDLEGEMGLLGPGFEFAVGEGAGERDGAGEARDLSFSGSRGQEERTLRRGPIESSIQGAVAPVMSAKFSIPVTDHRTFLRDVKFGIVNPEDEFHGCPMELSQIEVVHGLDGTGAFSGPDLIGAFPVEFDFVFGIGEVAIGIAVDVGEGIAIDDEPDFVFGLGAEEEEGVMGLGGVLRFAEDFAVDFGEIDWRGFRGNKGEADAEEQEREDAHG